MTIQNTSTTRRVACAVPGCKHTGHVLIQHLMEEHKMLPSAYLTKYPDSPLYSALGQAKLAEKFQHSGSLTRTARSTKKAKTKDVFPALKSAMEIEVYEEPGELTPALDQSYVFPRKQTGYLLRAMYMDGRNAAMIVGPSGTGKTQLVLQTMARVNWECLRVNNDSYKGRSEYIGEYIVTKGDMSFKYGPLPTAMKLGIPLLVDEYDMMNPHAGAILRPAMEDHARIVIDENGGEVIVAEPGFMVIATANTWGRGDPSGLYGSTSILSEADLQRFTSFIELDYLEPAVEIEILMKKTGIKKVEAEAFVKVAGEVRQKQKEGKIEVALSPRQLINWIEAYKDFGAEVEDAAYLSFLRAWPPEVQTAVIELIKHAFPQS